MYFPDRGCVYTPYSPCMSTPLFRDAVVFTSALDVTHTVCRVIGDREADTYTVLRAAKSRRIVVRYFSHSYRHVSTQICDAHVILILRRIHLTAHRQTRYRHIGRVRAYVSNFSLITKLFCTAHRHSLLYEDGSCQKLRNCVSKFVKAMHICRLFSRTRCIINIAY